MSHFAATSRKYGWCGGASCDSHPVPHVPLQQPTRLHEHVHELRHSLCPVKYTVSIRKWSEWGRISGRRFSGETIFHFLFVHSWRLKSHCFLSDWFKTEALKFTFALIFCLFLIGIVKSCWHTCLKTIQLGGKLSVLGGGGKSKLGVQIFGWIHSLKRYLFYLT